jgi:hypothetical protein
MRTSSLRRCARHHSTSRATHFDAADSVDASSTKCADAASAEVIDP